MCGTRLRAASGPASPRLASGHPAPPLVAGPGTRGAQPAQAAAANGHGAAREKVFLQVRETEGQEQGASGGRVQGGTFFWLAGGRPSHVARTESGDSCLASLLWTLPSHEGPQSPPEPPPRYDHAGDQGFSGWALGDARVQPKLRTVARSSRSRLAPAPRASEGPGLGRRVVWGDVTAWSGAQGAFLAGGGSGPWLGPSPLSGMRRSGRGSPDLQHVWRPASLLPRSFAFPWKAVFMPLTSLL